jgi:hypothetical protein
MVLRMMEDKQASIVVQVKSKFVMKGRLERNNNGWGSRMFRGGAYISPEFPIRPRSAWQSLPWIAE